MRSLTPAPVICTCQASGNVGSHITSALLSTGKHTITAITRADSKGTFPSGVIAKTVDYSQPETIVEALEGQEALVITLTPRAGDAEVKLVNAAGEAGVKYILTNEWCPDSENEGLVKDVSIFAHRGKDSVCYFWISLSVNGDADFFRHGQAKSAKRSPTSARVPTSASEPASGTNGVSPFPTRMASTSRTVVQHSSMKAKQKFLLLPGRRSEEPLQNSYPFP